jgi:hypothetical protein
MILGFSGYLLFGEGCPLTCELTVPIMFSGLTIGLAYDRITKTIPLFVILCVALA